MKFFFNITTKSTNNLHSLVHCQIFFPSLIFSGCSFHNRFHLWLREREYIFQKDLSTSIFTRWISERKREEKNLNGHSRFPFPVRTLRRLGALVRAALRSERRLHPTPAEFGPTACFSHHLLHRHRRRHHLSD